METASDGVDTVLGGMETARVVAWTQPEWWRGNCVHGGMHGKTASVAWYQN